LRRLFAFLTDGECYGDVTPISSSALQENAPKLRRFAGLVQIGYAAQK
jgi:hypothetical protein